MATNTMWARVSVYDNEGPAQSDFEAGLEYFREHLLPLARRTPGWIATLNLATPDRSRSVTISLWASHHEMRESEQAANAAVALPILRRPPAAIERYEVTLAEWSQMPVVDGGERLKRSHDLGPLACD